MMLENCAFVCEEEKEVLPAALLPVESGINQAGRGSRVLNRDYVSFDGLDHVRDSVHGRT
jgi:hypothetical protein